MVSSSFGYVLWILPNLLVGVAYLLFLRAALKTRILAALPSALFLAIPALGFGLGFLEVYHGWSERLAAWILDLLYLAALGAIVLVLHRIRTWLNLLQLVNFVAGTLLWYLMTLVVTGGAG